MILYVCTVPKLSGLGEGYQLQLTIMYAMVSWCTPSNFGMHVNEASNVIWYSCTILYVKLHVPGVCIPYIII